MIDSLPYQMQQKKKSTIRLIEKNTKQTKNTLYDRKWAFFFPI